VSKCDEEAKRSERKVNQIKWLPHSEIEALAGLQRQILTKTVSMSGAV
jgi:hypothetical protein